jgi:hypothetical protein
LLGYPSAFGIFALDETLARFRQISGKSRGARRKKQDQPAPSTKTKGVPKKGYDWITDRLPGHVHVHL